ncbi:MAG: hypothetical protein AVO34_00420 [Firmicutes bacterium ML8_F2]|jgi:uncharacterized membrane protein|nr:MAG: hypothetical protein AVO34_00420 [Firmicutes bacterium ML8_F2]
MAYLKKLTRNIKQYEILETEINSISQKNIWCEIFLSIFMILLGVYLSYFLPAKYLLAEIENVKYYNFMHDIVLVFTILFLLLFCIFRYVLGSEIKNIKAESYSDSIDTVDTALKDKDFKKEIIEVNYEGDENCEA